jgi:pilus assembly protein CpaB
MGVLISVALVAAIGLTLIARSIAGNRPAAAPVAAAAPEKPMVRVLVAKHDLATGDRISSDDFNWQPWPADGLNAAYITDGAASAGASLKAPAAVKIETAAVNAASDKAREIMNSNVAAAKMVDAIVREPILAGEPIIEAKVVHAGTGGVMAVSLDPGMRAMAVPLSAESAAGGFILPGDHVDVVQSRQVDAPGSGKAFAAGTILRNVKVLAIDQNAGHAQKAPAVVGATATLAVSPAQAELLVMSKSQGELTLILRSYADIGGDASVGPGPRVRGNEAAPTIVKVFRNGTPSDVTVGQ